MGQRSEYGVVPGSRLERALALLSRSERRQLLGIMSSRNKTRMDREKARLERRLAQRGIVL